MTWKMSLEAVPHSHCWLPAACGLAEIVVMAPLSATFLDDRIAKLAEGAPAHGQSRTCGEASGADIERPAGRIGVV